MQDLKDLTHDLHYENYRAEFIRSNAATASMLSAPSILRGKKITPDEADRLLQQKDQEVNEVSFLSIIHSIK